MELELAHLERRQRVANEMSVANIQARLIEALPAIAEQLPKPAEARTITIGGGGDAGVAGVVAQVMGVLEGFRRGVPPSGAP